jgi:nicotinamidase-related amidase
MNSWDDQKVRDALAKARRKKVVVSGLWTEVCNNSFALSAMIEGGYEIYMAENASCGTSKAAHDYGLPFVLSRLSISRFQPLNYCAA